jgi:hypothetical protein
MKIKKLSINIIGKGEIKKFLFTQIKISSKAYIYQVDTEDSIYYEVFKKKSKTNSKRDCLPTAKAFGVWAWTYPTYEKAMKKFNLLNNKK